MTCSAYRKDLPVQVGEDHGGDKTAMIPTIVDDHPAFTPLWRVIARELPETPRAHVVKVNITDQAFALFIHILAVFPHPICVADTRIFGHGLHDDPARFSRIRCVADRELNFLFGAISQAL